MNLSPRQIDQCSMWEFMACIDGYLLANGGKRQAGDISDEVLAAMGVEGF